VKRDITMAMMLKNALKLLSRFCEVKEEKWAIDRAYYGHIHGNKVWFTTRGLRLNGNTLQGEPYLNTRISRVSVYDKRKDDVTRDAPLFSYQTLRGAICAGYGRSKWFNIGVGTIHRMMVSVHLDRWMEPEARVILNDFHGANIIVLGKDPIRLAMCVEALNADEARPLFDWSVEKGLIDTTKPTAAYPGHSYGPVKKAKAQDAAR
jgi:hypothetical protein